MNKTKTHSKDKYIVIGKDGPYLVYGGVPLHILEIVNNQEGMSWEWKEGKTFENGSEYALCRCGKSGNMPFCDSSHSSTGFDGEETASRAPYSRQAEHFDGPSLVLSDVQQLCAFARFCDPGGKIWGLIEETDNPEARSLVIREAMNCPAGRLVIHDKKTRQEIERPLEPSIGIVEDTPLGCSGPLWVKGGIRIESADGKLYETRNRVTLCRCGVSDNKPFCNGSHASMKFNDGLMKRKKN